MLQRVRLALAFISDADLIVLDEPFNGLDLETVLSLREEITRFSKTDKKQLLLPATIQSNLRNCVTDTAY